MNGASPASGLPHLQHFGTDLVTARQPSFTSGLCTVLLLQSAASDHLELAGSGEWQLADSLLEHDL